MIKTITDKEFGDITVSFRANARAISVSVGTDGRLRATVPTFTPLFAITAMITTQRRKIRSLFTARLRPTVYAHGDMIGKSHHLVVVPNAPVRTTVVTVRGLNVLARLAPGDDLHSPAVQRRIRDTVISVLRTQAKAYLPRRLQQLAQQGGYHYERVRFSHAGTRWGSRSSTGTISLNIALMKLPTELIDYVLAHELAHTKHMNHSAAFWDEVAAQDPQYKLHRKYMKQHSPSI